MFSFLDMVMSTKTPFAFTYQMDGLTHDNRNRLAASAINEGYDRLLMIDSDMKVEPDLIDRLSADMDKGLEYVSALCTQRHIPAKPCVYKELEYEQESPTKIHHVANKYYDYPRDSLFECAGTGAAAVMIDVKLLKRVWDEYGLPFHPLMDMGEDLSFCWRAKQLGAKLYCDSRIRVGHCGDFCYDQDTYLLFEHLNRVMEHEHVDYLDGKKVVNRND
jgi:GT2 family glycosyltransferase